MDTNMKALLCVQTLENAVKAAPDIRGVSIHSDRGSQYTGQIYGNAVCKYGKRQSMNSTGGRCHDNACWVRMKAGLRYEHYETEKMSTDKLKTIIWRYIIGCWNNERSCSANGGSWPMVKRQQFYHSLHVA